MNGELRGLGSGSSEGHGQCTECLGSTVGGWGEGGKPQQESWASSSFTLRIVGIYYNCIQNLL